MGDAEIIGSDVRPRRPFPHSAALRHRVTAAPDMAQAGGALGGGGMIVAIVSFKLGQRQTLEKMRQVFESTAPEYLKILYVDAPVMDDNAAGKIIVA